MSQDGSPLKSQNSNNSIKTVNNNDEDEFMNDDDGGFRYVTVSKEELQEKGKVIAQMHN